MFPKHLFVFLAALVASLSVMPAIAIDGKPAVDRDTIVFGIGKEIGNLDGQVAATADSQRYGWQIYETLYAFDKTGNLEPRVASNVSISPDGLAYTFTIRPGIQFHDGSTLSAADVQYSLERILKPETKSTRRPYFANLVDSVTTKGTNLVTFHLKRPDGAFLNKIAGYLLIVPKQYTESLPSPEAFARAPVGSGPWRFVEQKVGQEVVLERFEKYWGDKPGIKRLIFRVLPDASSRVNALLAGEADIVDYIAPADVRRLRATKGLVVEPVPVGSPLAVRLYSNVEGTPFSHREVRLALNHGIDAEAIIKSVLHGIGKPLASYISSIYPYGVDPALKPYKYDPALARQLLAKAGYAQGFSTDLYCSSENPKELCEAVAAYWSAIGVRANIKVLDYAAWSRLNNTHKSGPATIMQFANALYDPIHPISGGASKEGTWSDYYNPEVEALIAQADKAIERKERDAIFRRIGRILHDDGHAVLLTELYYTYAYDSRIDWQPQQGSGYYNLRNIRWK
jgi:peptide/nickel transport system substrate-binding protein